MKPILLSFFVFFFYNSFAQTGVSQFSDPSGKYSTSASGFCLGCSISNPTNVADMDLSNYATIEITAGLAVTRGIRVKLNSSSLGNTYAGFFVTIGSVVSALPSVSVTTYKAGSFRQTVVTNGNIVTLLGGSSGYVMGLTSAGMDYDEVGITINGGIASVGMTARVYYALGGYSSMPMFTLPVKFTSVNVTSKNEKPVIKWTAVTEAPTSYEIQRSLNGIDFDSIGMRQSKINNSNENFSFTDLIAASAKVFYRVVATDAQNGSKTYSQVVTFEATTNHAPSLSVFPNPVQATTFKVTGLTASEPSFSVRLINSTGAVIYSSTLMNNNGQITVQLSHKPTPGFYSLEILSHSNNASTKFGTRVIIN